MLAVELCLPPSAGDVTEALTNQHPRSSTQWQGTRDSPTCEGWQCKTAALGTLPAGSEEARGIVAAVGLQNYQAGSGI